MNIVGKLKDVKGCQKVAIVCLYIRFLCSARTSPRIPLVITNRRSALSGLMPLETQYLAEIIQCIKKIHKNAAKICKNTVSNLRNGTGIPSNSFNEAETSRCAELIQEQVYTVQIYPSTLWSYTSCESWIDLKKSKRFRTTASLNSLDSCLNEIPKANLCWAGHWSFSSGFDDNPHILSYWDGPGCNLNVSWSVTEAFNHYLFHIIHCHWWLMVIKALLTSEQSHVLGATLSMLTKRKFIHRLPLCHRPVLSSSPIRLYVISCPVVLFMSLLRLAS